MMAFQAGGPHAQDRGLEAIAYAWAEMKKIPAKALWEKPQGKNEPLRMEKHFRIVPRGIGLVIGCCTFPTWNGFPGFFADLATGNAVVVKPHPQAILPLALTVRIAREVLAENGFDPNVVTLVAHDAGDDVAQKLALRPDVRLIDFTGSAANGDWLEANARQAQVYTEKSGVNQIVVDSADDFKSVARNIAFSLSLYTGQMCTAPQNIYVPKDGIDTADGPPHVRPGRLRHRRRRAEAPRRSGTRGRDPRRRGQRRRDGAAGEGAQARQHRARHAGARASALSPGEDPHAAHRQARRRRPRQVPRRMVRADRLRDRDGIDHAKPRDRAQRGQDARRADVVRVFATTGSRSTGRSTSRRMPASRCRST